MSKLSSIKLRELLSSKLAHNRVAVPTSSGSGQRGTVNTPVLFVIVAVLLAIALYFVIGRPDVTTRSGGTVTPASAMSGNDTAAKAGSVASLLSGLEEKVRNDPDSASDWMLLAKSYDHLGEPAKAMEAYQKAATLGLTDESFAAQISAGATQAPASADSVIRGSVSLSASARQLVQATDTVFIIARDAGGSPMPLAVVKKSAADFPIDFALSDSNSMVAGRGISSADRVIVEAKISASGDALSTKAGLVARSGELDPKDSQQLTLVLQTTTAPGE